MASIAVACYKPNPGCEEQLLAIVREHLPLLRSQDYLTERPAMTMRSSDGTIVEVFEWASDDAKTGAHKNPLVMGLWGRMGEVASFGPASAVPEFQRPFGNLEPLW